MVGVGRSESFGGDSGNSSPSMGGGRYGGSVGRSTGAGDALAVDVVINTEADVAPLETYGEAINRMQAQVVEASDTMGTYSDTTAIAGSNTKTLSEARSVSWDMMLLSRSLGVVNTHLLGNNAVFREFIGVLSTVAAASRVYLITVDLIRFITDLSAVSHGKKLLAMHEETVAMEQNAGLQYQANTLATLSVGLTADEIAETLTLAAATNSYTEALIAATAARQAANIMKGIELGVGVATTAVAPELGVGALAFLGMAQSGGYVPQTGLALVHKGEQIIPSGGSNFSNITINMSTGAISSGVDVDRMLDEMANRMASESRRRTGA